jgi:hypothetical protein
MRNKIELYPEEGRYAQLLLEQGSLRARVSQHAREEYLDVSIYQYRPSEWVLFLEMVAYLTYCRFDLPRFLDRVQKELDMRSLPFEEPLSDSRLQTGNNDGSDTISLSSEPTFATLPSTYPALSTFTTPCTDEAMAANDPKDPYCYACTYDYGPVFSHTHKTEPAVRTLCNHVHGTSCLEQECKAGRSKCPLCRRDLLGIEQRLNLRGCGAHIRLMKVPKACAEYDEEIDAYLLEGCKEVHAWAFVELLKKLASLVNSMADAKFDLWDSLSE